MSISKESVAALGCAVAVLWVFSQIAWVVLLAAAFAELWEHDLWRAGVLCGAAVVGYLFARFFGRVLAAAKLES